MRPDGYSFRRSFEPAGPSVFGMDRDYLSDALTGTFPLEVEGRRWTLPSARAALVAAGSPVSIEIPSRLTSASAPFTTGLRASLPASLTFFETSPLARELTGASPTAFRARFRDGALTRDALRRARPERRCSTFPPIR
jgi:hypothetical protein